MKNPIIFIAILLCAMLGHAQSKDNQRSAELRAHVASPSSYNEAKTYYGAEDGYPIANSPKITPDKAVYGLFGKIEITPSQNTFIARYYIENLDSPDPRTRQLVREFARLSGRTNTPYFQVRIPSELQKAYDSHARMNSPINVMGSYVGNSEIVMTDKRRVQIPVFDALFLQFQDNGPIAMISLKKTEIVQSPSPSEATKPFTANTPREVEAKKVTVDSVLEKYKVSFDCKRSQDTFIQRIICSNPHVGSLDGLLAATYKSRFATEFGTDPSIMRANQRSWIAERNKCGDAECLAKAYSFRITELCSIPVVSGVHASSDCDVFSSQQLTPSP